MNNKLKTILGISASIFAAVIIYVVLVLIEILPNPFLDTKDLVCYSIAEYPGYKMENYIEFNFDSWGKPVSAEKMEYHTYNTLDEAQNAYENLKFEYKNTTNFKFKLEDNTVIITSDFGVSLDEKKLLKKEIIKKYSEFNYECK